MDKSLYIYIVLALSFLDIVKIGNAQEFSQSGINIGVQLGGSKLAGEFPKGFSGIINEFDNKIGFASAFEISKYVSPRWEIGTDFNYSTLSGNQYSPDFTAEGNQPGIPSEINEPVEYKNNLLGVNFFFRYFFKAAGSESAFIPFIKAGCGYLSYNSKLKYIDSSDDDLLFGKGIDGYPKLSTFTYFLGTGFKTQLSSHLYLITSVDFKMVPYDFLDVMHNYNNDRTRLKLTGVYPEFLFGIFYTINSSEDNKNKQNFNKKGKSSNSSHLPFARKSR